MKARNPLEAYAESYELMAKIGNGRVDCLSVSIDIRQNMMPLVDACPPAQMKPNSSVSVTSSIELRAERAARDLANYFGDEGAFDPNMPEEWVLASMTRIISAALRGEE
ncbi:hypothetical protein GTU79_21360 [Sodalis ligni]|uniref:hypothetical protein n=1 Tax=Sodalis ligni TaxID=2697027 RepID=UPI00193FDC91|nr:hypothetical protein [Sodalis ligni]QWA09831.1 hypothetical protein GTU79_21360 [Sodalis ligni]